MNHNIILFEQHGYNYVLAHIPCLIFYLFFFFFKYDGSEDPSTN